VKVSREVKRLSVVSEDGRTADRIVVAMGESLRLRGYAATGIKAVLGAAGVPNGSLYHHFPGGKRQVADAALRSMGQAYAQLVGGLMTLDEDVPSAIEAAFRAAADAAESTGWANMCPVGTVAGEVADLDPELRETTSEIFGEWIDAGTELFVARGMMTGDARDLVVAVLAALEGAFVMARTTRSRDPLVASGKAVAAYAELLLNR